jgi:hypothetical protein
MFTGRENYKSCQVLDCPFLGTKKQLTQHSSIHENKTTRGYKHAICDYCPSFFLTTQELLEHTDAHARLEHKPKGFILKELLLRQDKELPLFTSNIRDATLRAIKNIVESEFTMNVLIDLYRKKELGEISLNFETSLSKQKIPFDTIAEYLKPLMDLIKKYNNEFLYIGIELKKNISDRAFTKVVNIFLKELEKTRLKINETVNKFSPDHGIKRKSSRRRRNSRKRKSSRRRRNSRKRKSYRR